MTFDIEPVLTWQRRGIVDLIDAYIERRKETAELLAIPGLYEKVWASSREFRRRKSLSLVDARKKLEKAASGEARGLLRTRH